MFNALYYVECCSVLCALYYVECCSVLSALYYVECYSILSALYYVECCSVLSVLECSVLILCNLLFHASYVLQGRMQDFLRGWSE